MTNMNTAQSRVIDPILTDIARGYRYPAHVGHVLFPNVPVSARGGQIIQFGKEGFRLINARRAPGAQTMQVGFGYSGEPFVLVQDALDAPIPRELLGDAQQVPKIDLGKRAVNMVMQQLTLALENKQASMATDASKYDPDHKVTLTGADKWSDDNSDPEIQIDEAKDQVRMACGIEPNRLVISQPMFKALKRHPKIREQFKYTTSETVTTQMLANLFDIEQVAVGKAVALDGPDDDAPFVDVWGNSAVLAYVPSEPKGPEEPSFGYTYALNGHPFVEKLEWDNSCKSWVYGVTYERAPVLAGAASGFLFEDVIDLTTAP